MDNSGPSGASRASGASGRYRLLVSREATGAIGRASGGNQVAVPEAHRPILPVAVSAISVGGSVLLEF